MTPWIIYALVDPRTDGVRYIGMSRRGLRRTEEHRLPCHLDGDRTHKGKWIRSLQAAGLTYGVRVLEIAANAGDLPAAEQRWIAYGRTQGWRLTNHTDGGPGLNNPSPETRAKMTANNLARRSVEVLQTPEARAKARASMTGKAKSQEHRAKLADARRGKRASAEARAKMSASRKGAQFSEEHRSKISAALTGKPHPYMVQRNKERIWTSEMRAKIGAARAMNVSNPPNAKYITIDGQTLSIAEWSRRTGIKYPVLRYRIVDAGWSPERAISTGVSH